MRYGRQDVVLVLVDLPLPLDGFPLALVADHHHQPPLFHPFAGNELDVIVEELLFAARLLEVLSLKLNVTFLRDAVLALLWAGALYLLLHIGRVLAEFQVLNENPVERLALRKDAAVQIVLVVSGCVHLVLLIEFVGLWVAFFWDGLAVDVLEYFRQLLHVLHHELALALLVREEELELEFVFRVLLIQLAALNNVLRWRAQAHYEYRVGNGMLQELVPLVHLRHLLLLLDAEQELD